MNEASLQFHIEQSDYFGTLATVLDLIRQDLDRREYRRHAPTLAGLRDELMYLQGEYRIQKGENLPSSPLHTVHLLSMNERNESDRGELSRLKRMTAIYTKVRVNAGDSS